METLIRKRKLVAAKQLVFSSKSISDDDFNIIIFSCNSRRKPKPAPVDYKPSHKYYLTRGRVLTTPKPVKRNIVNVFHFHEIQANRLIKSIFASKKTIKPVERQLLWENAKLG